MSSRNSTTYFDELFAYFARADAWLLYPEVLETLAALKQRGLILAVISNFDSRLVRILDGLNVGASFEHIFVSSAVGYAKPEARIFDIALARFGLTPGKRSMSATARPTIYKARKTPAYACF